jgi:hypothetical protein
VNWSRSFSETDQEAANKPELSADGHDLELWEGTRQVALLTRSNLLLKSGGFLRLRAGRRQAVCFGTINGRGDYVHVPGPRRHSMCDWARRFSAGGALRVALRREA